jgi:predicted transglutaminase-like cysteine proteinase
MRHALSGRSIARARILSLVSKAALPVLSACALMSAPAEAQQFARLATSTRSSEAYGPSKSIDAWTKYCARYASECAVNTAEPETIELTAKVWALILATNRNVNRRIKPATDQQH